MTKLKKIIVAGLLIATSIILNRFLSIRTPITTIGISFVATTISGMLLGPWWTMFVSGIADVIGALLFPTGAFFPGYTLTAVITGFFDGIMFKDAKDMSKKKFLVHAIIAHTLIVVICSIGLNSLWVWYLTKKAVAVILPTRLINAAVMLPIRVIVSLGLHVLFIKSGVYGKLYSSPGDVDETLVSASEDEEGGSLQTEEENKEENIEESTQEDPDENSQKIAKNHKNSLKNSKKSQKFTKNQKKSENSEVSDASASAGGEQ